VTDANGNLFICTGSTVHPFTPFVLVLVVVLDRELWRWSAIRFGLARERGSDGTYRTYRTNRL
jgi:hypothetical protein